MTRSRTWSVLILPVVAVVAMTASAVAAADKAVLKLTAFAVDVGNVGAAARAGTLDVVIERWSTDAEEAALRDVLIEKGEDALLSALQKIRPRAGYIRGTGGLGWDIHFARLQPFGDGGRRVIVATDRPMSFWELRNRPRSADYAFTLAEIRLTKDGRGEGKLARAASITWNRGTRAIEIENYGMEPVRLTEVRVQ
jgi:hypothetical protein